MNFRQWIMCLSFCGILINTTAYASSSDIVLSSYDPGQTIQDQTSSLGQQEKQAANELFHHAGDPVAGNPNGSLSIAQFYDYQCSHCQNMVPILAEIARANPNLRIVYKEFPIRGDLSMYAAKAALAAKKQGKFLPFHEALMRLGANLSAETISQTAQNLGLDQAKFKADMDSDAVKQQIAANEELADKLQLESTPGFYLGRTNGSPIDFINGEVDRQYMQDEINKLNHSG